MVINYVNKKKVKFIRPPLTAISVWGSQADRVFGALHRARPPLCPLALVMPSVCRPRPQAGGFVITLLLFSSTSCIFTFLLYECRRASIWRQAYSPPNISQ